MRIVIVILVLFFSWNILAQEHRYLPMSKEALERDSINQSRKYKNKYPQGVYLKKEDFIKGIPSHPIDLVAKNFIGEEKYALDTVYNDALFYSKRTDNIIRTAFAISNEGELFFQIHHILENRNNEDYHQTSDFSSAFVKVLSGGENYLYCEAALVSIWKKGAVGITFGGVGTVIQDAISYKKIKRKGVVWDFKNEEFNVFRNCSDYNDFIDPIYHKGVQTCDKQRPDMHMVREAIAIIK